MKMFSIRNEDFAAKLLSHEMSKHLVPGLKFGKEILTFCVFVLLCLILFLSCSNAEEKGVLSKQEKKAEAIFSKAELLWKTGKQVDALKLYDQLALKFSETSAKKIAEEKLLKKGFSIGNSLVSWTSQRMIELENRIISYREQKGSYPEGYEIKHPQDAWGNEIYFRLYSDKPEYDFIVFSNGADKKKGTDDDLLVVHSKDESPLVRHKKGPLSIEEIRNLGDSLGAEESAEIVLSLDKLKEAAGQKKSRSESEEMQLSLEELKNFAERPGAAAGTE